MSYDITTNVGKVRLLIGDTDSTDEVFTDAEITYFLTSNSSNITLAAADACDAWAAKYGASPSTEKIGDYAYSQTIIFRLMQLSKRLRETAVETPYLTWAEMDLTAGSGITVEED